MVVCPAVNCNAVLLSVCLALPYFSAAASVSISIVVVIDSFCIPVKTDPFHGLLPLHSFL